eukprot:364289-Chlamydomonas_euryale.AAC.1
MLRGAQNVWVEAAGHAPHRPRATPRPPLPAVHRPCAVTTPHKVAGPIQVAAAHLAAAMAAALPRRARRPRCPMAVRPPPPRGRSDRPPAAAKETAARPPATRRRPAPPLWASFAPPRYQMAVGGPEASPLETRRCHPRRCARRRRCLAAAAAAAVAAAEARRAARRTRQ